MECKNKTYVETPLGIAEVVGDEKGIQSIKVVEEKYLSNLEKVWIDEAKKHPENTPASLQKCVRQLQEYFSGDRKKFSIELNPKGTSFQKKVWRELLKIPFGKTSTYLKQAKTMGDPKAIRAIANANGKNPIWVVIPCHRIIGTDGSLTGYAGGLWRKQWLLNHESSCKQQALF